MNLLTSLRTLILALILSIGISYAYAAWSPPGAAQNPPPSGNIDAPVNVGAGSQTKQGDLSSNNFFSAPLGFFGSAGIGLVPVPPSLKLGVAGNTGADAYCDRSGGNCISAGTGAGGIQQRITGTCSSGTFIVGVNPDGSVACAPGSGGGPQLYQCPNIQNSIYDTETGGTSYCATNCTGQISTGSTCTYETTVVAWPCSGGPWLTASCGAI